MRYAGRFIPVALATLLLVVGCQSAGTTTGGERTAYVPPDRESLSIELAAANRELNETQSELTGAITDLITVKNTMNDYVQHLVTNEGHRQEMERRLAEARRARESDTCTDAELAQTLREYLECMVQTGIEDRTAGTIIETIHARASDRMTSQAKRIDAVIARVEQLRTKIDELQRQLAANH